MSAGLAIDYGRAVSVKSEAQASLDQALLSAVAQGRKEGASVTDKAHEFFVENWKQKYGDHAVDIQIVDGDDGRVTGKVKLKLPTRLWQIAGYEDMQLEIESAVKLGEGAVELALTLDTTGSMSGTKIETLKDSAKDLVSTIFDVPNAAERVSVGIVPFAQYTNVGMDNRNASWLAVPTDSSTTEEYCYDKREVISSSNCRTETATGTDDGGSYTYTYETCDYEYGDPTPVCEPHTSTTTWYGCAGSRDYPLDTKDENFSVQVPGIMNVSCGQPITELTNDKSELSTALDALTASGDTYIPSGLSWGWRVLSDTEPFSGGTAYGAKKDGILVRKILVLMTDGMNTRSPDYPTHNDSDNVQANSLTAELCANIKATGIEIFTVAFDVSDDTTKTMLRDCASDKDNYFDARSAGELKTAFNNIAKDITPLHLAK